LAQAIGQAAIQKGCKVLYRETHILLDELAEAVADGTRKEYMESVATVPLLIITKRHNSQPTDGDSDLPNGDDLNERGYRSVNELASYGCQFN